MVKPVLVYPSPVLDRRCSPVTADDKQELGILVQDLLDTLIASRGVGLSAVQIGVLKNVIALNIPGHGLEVFYNPKFKAISREREPMQEGCLSFPEIFRQIKRYHIVEFTHTDAQGLNKKVERAEGLRAQAIQHEIDHLNGVTFIKYLSFEARRYVHRKLTNENGFEPPTNVKRKAALKAKKLSS